MPGSAEPRAARRARGCRLGHPRARRCDLERHPPRTAASTRPSCAGTGASV